MGHRRFILLLFTILFAVAFEPASSQVLMGGHPQIRKADKPRLTDSWTSSDKLEHLFGSATLSAGGLLALRVTHNDETPSAVLVLSGVTCAGLLKEVFDMNSPHHQASWKDLTVDVLGALLGLYVARTI